MLLCFDVVTRWRYQCCASRAAYNTLHILCSFPRQALPSAKSKSSSPCLVFPALRDAGTCGGCPAGDSQALPGYISIYLQVTDPKNASGKWDCFASYRLCVANQADDAKSIARDSWHRQDTPPAAVTCTKSGNYFADSRVVQPQMSLLRREPSMEPVAHSHCLFQPQAPLVKSEPWIASPPLTRIVMAQVLGETQIPRMVRLCAVQRGGGRLLRVCRQRHDTGHSGHPGAVGADPVLQGQRALGGCF